MKNIEISFNGNGEYGIHDGFFNAVAIIDDQEFDFQCCANDGEINFEDCGYDWGLCGDLNAALADVVGYDVVLELLKKAYKEYKQGKKQ